MSQPTAATIAQAQIYAHALGFSVATALSLLKTMQPALRERVLLAAATQSGRYLRDPVEFDPRHRDSIAQAGLLAAAEAAICKTSPQRGFTLGIWYIQARILREQFGIDWLSPREMNPHILFD